MAWGKWIRLGGMISISSPTAVPSTKDGGAAVTCFTVNTACNIAAIDVNPFTGAALGAWQVMGVGGLPNAVISPLSPGAILDLTTKRVNVFALTTDSILRHSSYPAGAWESLGGDWTHGVSALSRLDRGRLECFTVGTNSKLYHRVYGEMQQGPLGPIVPEWGDWDDLGGQLTSAPAAISWGPNRNDVFALGLKGEVLHAYWTPDTDWEWAHSPFGKDEFIQSPAVASWGVDRLDLFTVSTDSRIYHTEWDGQGWSAPQDLAGPPPDFVTIRGPAAIAKLGPEEGQFAIVLFAVGTDSNVYLRTFTSG